VLVYRCIHGTAPAYLLADLLCISNVNSQQRLRSATTSAFIGRRTDRRSTQSTVGDRAFAAVVSAAGGGAVVDNIAVALPVSSQG